jgi:hypothetical protein
MDTIIDIHTFVAEPASAASSLPCLLVVATRRPGNGGHALAARYAR